MCTMSLASCPLYAPVRLVKLRFLRQVESTLTLIRESSTSRIFVRSLLDRLCLGGKHFEHHVGLESGSRDQCLLLQEVKKRLAIVQFFLCAHRKERDSCYRHRE
jgi:hypothetical protein